MYTVVHIFVNVGLPIVLFVARSAEQDKPVIHIYDGSGCEKSAMTSLSHIHSSPIISMKVRSLWLCVYAHINNAM